MVGHTTLQAPDPNDHWENIGYCTYRMKVPGGWWYRYEYRTDAPTSVFVPEPPQVNVFRPAPVSSRNILDQGL